MYQVNNYKIEFLKDIIVQILIILDPILKLSIGTNDIGLYKYSIDI